MSKKISQFFLPISKSQEVKIEKHSKPDSSKQTNKDTDPTFDVSKNQTGKIGNNSTTSTTNSKTEFYHGSKLDASWLLNTHKCLEKVKLGKRYGIKCMICFKHIGEAKKYSRNGNIPIADGVRCDDKQHLERIIDHLSTNSHEAAANLDKMQENWLNKANQHPWVKTLKSHNAEKVNILIEMAVDVYNDSRQLTLSANSWTGRSLAKKHTNIQIASYMDNGLSSEFVEFKPSAVELQYRNPQKYREMLDFVAMIEMQKLVDQLKEADCFSIQVDGSVDKYGVDNKFITARFVSKNRELTATFLGIKKANTRGSEGLLDSVKLCFKDLGIENLAKEKLTGLTTDGESANTGRNSGLWVRLKEYLERDIFCIWCVAHRTDLVLNDLETTISEVKIWKIDLKAVATFYRGSAIRFDELIKIGEELKVNIRRFPAYTEVRFVEHLVNLSKAVLKNYSCMKIDWEAIANNMEATKSEKAVARGFSRKWVDNSRLQQLTSFMMDLLERLEMLQKDCQKSLITIPDVELSKSTVLQRISIMENQPYPGGYEEKLERSDVNRADSEDEEDNANFNCNVTSCKKRRVFNSLVPTERNWPAVRNEIILSCKEFLAQRLHDDQQAILSNINDFIEARSAVNVVDAARHLVKNLFGESAISSFTDDVTSLFAAEKLPPPLEMGNATAKLFHYLKVSVPQSIFSKLVQSFICLTPHSSSPERAVSVHTILKTCKQSCYTRETLNSRMYIALNGSGTAFYDPRPAVAKFLEAKERRRRLPDEEVYKDKTDTKKFFSKHSCV